MKGLFLDNEESSMRDFAAPIWKGIETGKVEKLLNFCLNHFLILNFKLIIKH